MSERNDATAAAEVRPVSRRDFLKRAGSEAATTAALLPGVGAAARAAGIVAPTAVGESPLAPRAWWQRLVQRRSRQSSPARDAEGDNA